MVREERLKIYKEAKEIWGLVGQYDQCIEEMAELTVALNKYKRKTLHNEYQGQDEIENNVIEEIADVFICIEEMAELTKELCKLERYRGTEKESMIIENIKEEIADVLNTVEQLYLYYGSEEIDKIRDFKLKRGLEKLNNKR